jgi:hypothetical protein
MLDNREIRRKKLGRNSWKLLSVLMSEKEGLLNWLFLGFIQFSSGKKIGKGLFMKFSMNGRALHSEGFPFKWKK